MTPWQTVLLAFGGNAFLLAVLGISTKSLVSHLLQKDAEKFKSNLELQSKASIEQFKIDLQRDADQSIELLKNALKSKSDLAIELLKSDLQIAATEHQVRFSKLHETRAEVIAELYALLVEAMWATESFVSPMEWSGEPPKEEKYGISMNKITEFYRYFDKHRIYLSESLCAVLDTLIRELRGHAIHFGVWVDIKHLTPESQKEKMDAWMTSWKKMTEDIPKARLELEKELRGLLGATGAPNPPLNSDPAASGVAG